MPRKPKRPCSYPSCPNLTDGQYCKEHEAAARRQYNKYERSADVNKKYGRAWKRIRDRYAAAHPLCEMCLKEGRLTPVDEVHHIVPISQGGTHARDNLMSLCRSCHTKIHHDLFGPGIQKLTAGGFKTARRGCVDPSGKRNDTDATLFRCDNLHTCLLYTSPSPRDRG